MLDFITDTSSYRAIRRTEHLKEIVAPCSIRNILNSLPVVHATPSGPNQRPGAQKGLVIVGSDEVAGAVANTTKASPLLSLNRLQEYVGFGRSHLYALISKGKFPPPVKIGRSSRWPLQEVDDWIHSQIAARDNMISGR